MSLSDKVQYFARTDVGRLRDHNEDNYLVDKKLSLSVVADGMGGHAAGEVASALAVRIIHEEIKAHREVIEAFGAEGADERAGSKEILNVLEQAVQRACAKIHEEAKADPAKRGMGTTLSALLIAGSQGFIAHVGDSRIYLLRGGKIQQVTEDHTVYNELVKRGKLTRDQIEKVAQKNAITRAVGVYERVEVDTLTIEVLPGDQFLLASDGLHGYIAHTAELEPYLEEADGETAAEELIALANRKGGKDNITCGARAARRGRRRGQRPREEARAEARRAREDAALLTAQRARAAADHAGGGGAGVRDRRRDRAGGGPGRRAFHRAHGARPGHARRHRAARGRDGRSLRGDGADPRDAALGDGDGRRGERAHHAAPGGFLRDPAQGARAGGQAAVAVPGVLADRLDQTSRDLSNAKTELLAEDISEEIFPDPEEEAAAARASAPPS
jgi:serine/threonine protein phosphatase PrpC